MFLWLFHCFIIMAIIYLTYGTIFEGCDRRDSVPRYLGTYPGGFQIGASTSEMAVLSHIRPRFSSVSTLSV